MAREIIGHIDCPHCGAVATVHQNARGSALRYYRCGEVVGGFSTGCGTVQIYGRSGQAWIAANMRPIDPKASAPVPAEQPQPGFQRPRADDGDPKASAPVPAPAPITQPAPAPAPARKSVLGSLAQLLSEE
jgi:hypothetical protein